MLYILPTSTIMVSMWSGNCRAVILSLDFAQLSAGFLHRHRKPLDRDVYTVKYSETSASNQIVASLVKTCPVGSSLKELCKI